MSLQRCNIKEITFVFFPLRRYQEVSCFFFAATEKHRSGFPMFRICDSLAHCSLMRIRNNRNSMKRNIILHRRHYFFISEWIILIHNWHFSHRLPYFIYMHYLNFQPIIAMSLFPLFLFLLCYKNINFSLTLIYQLLHKKKQFCWKI